MRSHGSSAASRLALALAASLLPACSGARTPPASPGDIVQIGYGEVPAALSTGAVASLDADQIRARHVLDVADLFETMPGVTVLRRGVRSSLRIRMPDTASGAEPLVIIDGVPLSRYGGANALAGLLPQDIERIDVLKDGATAMYGVRGGRGVVLITTRLRR